MELRRPDGSCLTSGRAWPASGRRLRLIFRTRTTILLIFEAAYFQTALIYRPDGGPTEAIYIPLLASFHHTPQNPSFWQLVSKVSFWIFFFLLLFVLLQLSHILGILLEISCQFIYFETVRIFFWNVFEIMRCMYLPCWDYL
jgi:hypothetical protein